MVKFIYLLIMFVFCSGCATANINKISLGMDKGEVIKTLGNPTRTSAQGNTEYLFYNCLDIYCQASQYVRLINGTVESYGQNGDFDSTQQPLERSDINLNVNQ